MTFFPVFAHCSLLLAIFLIYDGDVINIYPLDCLPKPLCTPWIGAENYTANWAWMYDTAWQVLLRPVCQKSRDNSSCSDWLVWESRDLFHVSDCSRPDKASSKLFSEDITSLSASTLFETVKSLLYDAYFVVSVEDNNSTFGDIKSHI